MKVRPNDLPRGVPSEKTIEQIGKALNVVGEFGAGFGQQIRLEVHGAAPGCRSFGRSWTSPPIPMWASAGTRTTRTCGSRGWNPISTSSNRLGHHARPATRHPVPVPGPDEALLEGQLPRLVALEAGGKDPPDRVKALAEQRQLFDDYLAAAKLAG